MIKFMKKGRPTTAQKEKLTAIKNFLSDLMPAERHPYPDKVTPEGLDALHNSIFAKNNGATSSAVEEPVHVKEPENVIPTKTENPVSEPKEDHTPKSEEPVIHEPSNDIPESFNPNPNAAQLRQRSYTLGEDDLVDSEIIGEPMLSADKVSGSSEKDPFRIEIDKEIKDEADKLEEDQKQFKKSAEPVKTAATKPTETKKTTTSDSGEVDEKTKKLAAKQLAKTILGLYRSGHEIAAKWVKYPEKKLVEMAMNGEIDLKHQITMADGEVVTIYDIITSQNNALAEVFSYDDEFDKECEPVLTRVLQKHGMGIKDEHYLAALFLKDAGMKVGAAVGVLKGMKEYVKMSKEQHAERMAALNKVEQVEVDQITQTKDEPVVQQPDPDILDDDAETFDKEEIAEAEEIT